jgi:hypothetical protein
MTLSSLSRSVPLLILGLIALAAAIFVQWPQAGGRLFFGLAGIGLLAAWALGYPRGHARERYRGVERRLREAERRQGSMEVAYERRALRDRRMSLQP